MDKELYLKLLTITCLSLALLGLMISSISSNIYANYVGISMWGSYASGNGQFDKPLGIAVDSKGNVSVADAGNNRIQKFQLVHPCPSGTTQVGFGVCFNTEWGSYGSGKGQFSFPEGIAVDSKGNVFVADTLNHRIQTFP